MGSGAKILYFGGIKRTVEFYLIDIENISYLSISNCLFIISQ